MKKIFLSVLILIMSCSISAFAVEAVNDPEIQKTVGGLYSLVSAIELNNKAKTDINSLVRFFERIPPGWQNEVKIESDKKSIWAGISVAQNSPARSYLRNNAQKLKIYDAPNGNYWLGSDFAWVKAADIAKKKINPVEFSAAEGDGTIFFSLDGSEWFAAWPNFKDYPEKEILEKHGTDSAPELHAPAAQDNQTRTSIYDEVKPSSVRVPDEMTMSRKKSSFDMSMEVGDVIFNPIPNVHR